MLLCSLCYYATTDVLNVDYEQLDRAFYCCKALEDLLASTAHMLPEAGELEIKPHAFLLQRQHAQQGVVKTPTSNHGAPGVRELFKMLCLPTIVYAVPACTAGSRKIITY